MQKTTIMADIVLIQDFRPFVEIIAGVVDRQSGLVSSPLS